MHRTLALTLSLLATAAPSAADDAALKAGVFSPARPAPDFSLSGSDGAELKLSRYRGKVVILAFGFTSCTNVCPVTLSVLAQTRRKLGAAREGLQVVYVTVDPERDDAARMREYLAAFDPSFIGGTGAAERLEAVRREYGIIASKQVEGASYSVAHSSFTYLIDRDGALRALMPYGHTADDYVHDVRILLES
jgi:protein SCO1/2